MEMLMLRLHQQQVAHQCKAGLLALDIAGQGLNNNDQDVFWASIQNCLAASANIAKSLWGQGGKLAAERAAIRQSLNIGDDSPFAATDLRNHLEHFDERLDRWHRTSVRHNYADFIIGPAANTISGMEPGDIFRHFDPNTQEVIFWGEHHSLAPLRDALVNLLPIASAEAAKPHWADSAS
jgi:hypothetical protein